MVRRNAYEGKAHDTMIQGSRGVKGAMEKLSNDEEGKMTRNMTWCGAGRAVTRIVQKKLYTRGRVFHLAQAWTSLTVLQTSKLQAMTGFRPERGGRQKSLSLVSSMN